MKTPFRRTSLRLASLLLACVVGAAGSILLTHAGPAHAEAATGNTVTVFVDATFGFRKNHMATKLTQSHAEYAARGYRFVDMSPYNENGDLVGFFVTYTRQ
jgi:hypothetical protein